MGCGDVVVRTPRGDHSAWDVQLDDISLPGLGEMAKPADAPVEIDDREINFHPRFFTVFT